MTKDRIESGQGPVQAVVVLAAGGGTRMKSRRSKLLHELCGKSMLSYAVSAAAALDPRHLVVVVGHQRVQVAEHLESLNETVSVAVQEQQLGTGHAVTCGLKDLPDFDGEVVVTYGDVPLLTGETLRNLVSIHRAEANAVTVLTAEINDPTGYGRIIRTGGKVTGIVEHRDASDEQLLIREINSGIYVFDAATLRDGLRQLGTDNAQGEQYLTDILRYAYDQGRGVGAMITDDIWQTEGINDRVQLARMNEELNRRILHRWMRDGVTVVDPRNTWVDVDVDLSPDVTLMPGVILQGATTVANGAVIGPDTTLQDVEVGQDAHVVRSHGAFAIIGEGANVGPFSYLRPGTQLGAGGKIGAFVETKNAVIGEGAKVPHLSYVGDGVIGEGANIGAGTIFANYDGVNKSTTHVGKAAFIGSNSVLVAPVDVADGAFVAAGSAVTEDVPPGSLAVARGRQHNATDWTAKRRPDSKAARAAADSDGATHPAVVESRAKLKG